MSNPWLVLIETKLQLSLYTKLERRNPCSKPPTVYVDLSTRNDWTVKITTVDLPMEIRKAFSIIRRDLWSRYLFYDLLKLKPSKKRKKNENSSLYCLFTAISSAGHTSLLHITKKRILQNVIKRGHTGRSPLNCPQMVPQWAE